MSPLEWRKLQDLNNSQSKIKYFIQDTLTQVMSIIFVCVCDGLDDFFLPQVGDEL